MSFKLEAKNFNQPKKDKAVILIAQPSWSPEQIKRKENQIWQLELSAENENFIDAVLAKADTQATDLIVFPEFSIPETHLEKIANWSASHNTVVIAGSTYLKRQGKFYNTASVFFQGNQYKTEKHDLSPLETSGFLGYGPSPGRQHFYFENSPVGNIGVMICADEFYENTRSEFSTKDLDILCVIAVQSKAKEHHQSIDRIVKEYDKGIYVVYCNAFCKPLCDGRSAFFGNDYNERLSEYREAGLTPNDGVDKRIVEMPFASGCLIISCDLQNKVVSRPNKSSTRSLTNLELPYVFENGNLRQITLEEVKQAVAKPAKAKLEYQSSIPPVKTFVSDYIGRQTDIDYLREFLNNEQKHFLLLYGVGGMGKSHLLYCCMKDYKQKTFFYHTVSPNEDFTLNKLFEICLLPKPDVKLPLEERQNQFVKKFQENDAHLILDDYYEVLLEEVKSILPKLVGIGKGKLLLLSRIIPSNINHLKSEFFNHKILPLPESEFKQVIQNYIQDKSIILTEEEIHLIFEKAQGYPLGGQLIIDAKPYSKNLQELLADIGKFEAELDPEGKDYSGRLLNRIFQSGENSEIKLLCEFSALFGVSDIETIRQLPSYNLRLFEGLHSRKSFVDMDADGKFSSHALIRDFAYFKLQNKEDLHLKLAKYFEDKITGRTDNDWKLLNEAILHYTNTQESELRLFSRRVERNFADKKGIIEENVIKTIRNYTTLVKIFPDKFIYYYELGIAYRKNNQLKNAIETFLIALDIYPKDFYTLKELGSTYLEYNQDQKTKAKAIEIFLRALEIRPENIAVLFQLGDIYRKNNHKTKAIEIFLRVLKINEEHTPSLNQLGITYRENNQKTKAIETLLKALKIKVDNEKEYLPSLNQLGITYRENGQFHEAVKILLRALDIDSTHLHSLNELGITYRENNQIDEAIEICRRVLEISNNKQTNLNLLQIYLFFEPNREKAKENYDVLFMELRRHSAFNTNRKKYETIIFDLNEIINTSINELKRYESFLYLSIQYKSYVKVLPILEKLDKKFPDSLWLKSRLGKTLINRVIGRYEEGRKFLKEAIQLFKNENNSQQAQQHILYYFYNFLNNQELHLLEEELKRYEHDLIQDSNYFRFMAHYSYAKNQDIDEAIRFFEQAIEFAERLMDKRGFAESLLTFLSDQNSKLYKKYFSKFEELL